MLTVQPGVVSLLNSGDIGILGCINKHDGSGFIHALLEAYHPAYAKLNSQHYRTHLAKSIRIGALPAVLRSRYGSEPLCANGCLEARSLFNSAIAYGSPLPSELMRDYAQYLGVAYKLYDASLDLTEEYFPQSYDKKPCHIVMLSDNEYHLLVKIVSSQKGKVRYEILT